MSNGISFSSLVVALGQAFSQLSRIVLEGPRPNSYDAVIWREIKDGCPHTKFLEDEFYVSFLSKLDVDEKDSWRYSVTFTRNAIVKESFEVFIYPSPQKGKWTYCIYDLSLDVPEAVPIYPLAVI